MAVGIDSFAEKSLRALTHPAEPVGGHQFTGVGIRVGKCKNLSPEIFKVLKAAGIVDNQVGLVKMAFLHLRSSQQLKSVFFFTDHIGSRADKGQINLAFTQ